MFDTRGLACRLSPVAIFQAGGLWHCAVDAAPGDRMSSPYQLAELFVTKGPPYWFFSNAKDAKHLGKKQDGAGGNFDFSRKMWYAKNNELFVKMWNTGKVQLEERAICGNMVVKVIQELKAGEEARRHEKKVEAKHDTVKSADHVEIHNRKDLHIPDDLPEDIAELERRVCLVLQKHPQQETSTNPERHGAEVVSDIIAKSRTWTSFGPRSGISDAKRVLRAFDLEICKDVKDAVDGTFAAEELKEIARRNKRNASRNKTPVVRDWADDTLQAVPTDDPASEPEAEPEEMELVYPELAPEIVCPICENVISEQFMDCDCVPQHCNGYEVWKRCKRCHKMLRADNFQYRVLRLATAEHGLYSTVCPFCACS